jgi:DNA polymerase-3 subunit gamma/tau
MYQVLYRKWRPNTFSDVAGQPQVTVTLKNELKNGRINHAYLFTGSRGTGKTSCAKIFAKAVNCLDLQDGEPCGKCENCIDFANGNLLDVVEMDAASNRGIEDIRALIEESTFSPAKGKYRVYIVDEVHMLTKEAFNALLKTLEEPPAHVIFILATTEVHKLPQTILSRCQRFDFHRISPEDIAARLTYIAGEENVTITKEAAMLTAVIADGALRDSLSIMDRCIGISNNIDANVVRQAAGLAQKDYLFTLSSACINKNVQKALTVIDKLHHDSKDMARLCAELIDHFRNFMLIKTVKNPREMVIMNDKEFDEALIQCGYVSLADIIYFIDVLQRSAERMGRSSSDRTELETALVKLTSPELDVSQEALTARLVKLEKAVKMGGFSQPQPQAAPVEESPAPVEEIEEIKEEPPTPIAPPVEKEQPEPNNPLRKKLEEMRKQMAVKEQPEPAEPLVQTQPKPKVSPRSLEEIYAQAKPFLRWPEIVDNMKNYSKAIAMSFADTEAYVSGDYLLIDAKTDMSFNLLKRDPEQKERIRNSVQEMTGIRYKLGPYKPPEKREVKNDPLTEFANKLKEKGIEITEE